MTKQQAMELTADQIGLDFYALRKDGIAMLQELCSASWTDYNLHDPGVTTLELLCYALTDLAYRTDFGVPDYLAGANGEIDYRRQALYPPQEILASQALTTNDYRKLIYDRVPGVAEVWVRPAAGVGGKGLMSIFVMAPQNAPAGHEAALARAVKALYAAHRSLCEDAAEIKVVKAAPFWLKGDIEIEHGRDPATILAQLMTDCATCVSSGMSVMRFQQALAEEHGLDRLFEGPATRHGHIGMRDTDETRKQFTVSELIAVIQAVPGVRRVRNLSFRFRAGHESSELPADPATGRFPLLQFPRRPEELELLQLVPPQGIVFGVSERMIPAERVWREKNSALYADADLVFRQLAFQRMAFRNSDQDNAARSLELPKGKYREFSAYYSIQHQFPAIYGINAAGIPRSESEQRKVEAAQLKAFLFPFEQLMANYLQNLQELPQLFSVSTATPQSYFAQYLGQRTIPGIDVLYSEASEPVPQAAGMLPPGHDDYYERKGRVLDYLLALYGEEFSQSSLRRFNQYHLGTTEEWLLHAKVTLLRELVDLGGRRATAFDYLRNSENAPNVARLQRRVGILLGLHQPECRRSFGQVLQGHKLSLVDEGSFDGAHPEHGHDHTELVTPAPADPAGPALAVEELALPFEHVSASFLRHGCSPHNYRLGAKGERTVVYFHTNGKQRELASFPDRHAAQHAAHGYAAALARLNLLSEGLHIVEHILLRPRGDARYRIDNFDAGEAFFSSRISVVLTGWTLRFHDPEFRNFAEETLSQHCPAHIYPAFHWLDPHEMHEFEAQHTLWCKHLRAFEQLGGSAHMAQLDEAAEQLTRFLSRRIAGKK